MHAAEFRRCLDECDVAGIRALWTHVSPHLPQPANEADALATIHRARTESQSVTFAKRAYSHAWLTERALPSGLPDHLRPMAERMYPRVVDAVGVSVRARSPAFAPIAAAVQASVSDAVAEVYAAGRGSDIPLVRLRMREARDRTLRSLIG